ncbi:hypothetical protein O6H91_07G104000 [Diphasiastrum complanatum]|uniref:Uncharacterized protein n=1 Tax=Diphasiastrum complanatum TaxID=34168 RepID=A0ACC2D8R9_DIPCM|nr:hypothetical protein O6H91_07G104000 [Diphasiastrum complanatum]
MEVPGLPLDFYCRSACRCLKKAASSRKTCLFTDELQHLQKFESIVSSTIPSHPHYSKRKGEKAILELQIYLLEARKWMQKLHGRFVPRSQTVDKVTTKTVGRRFSRTLLEQMNPFVKLRTNPRKTINSPRKQDWEAWVRKLHESYYFLGPSSSRSGMPGVSKKKRLSKERYFHNLPASSTIDPNKSSSIRTSCPAAGFYTERCRKALC